MKALTLPLSLAIALALLLVISGWAPYERSTWLLEVAPIFVAVPVMAYSYRRFPLTRLLYILIFLHAGILLVGGTYTYARVPLGFWLQDILGADRNPYDKIGHFAQGFVPSLVARELFIRGGYVRGRTVVVVNAHRVDAEFGEVGRNFLRILLSREIGIESRVDSPDAESPRVRVKMPVTNANEPIRARGML